MFAVIEIMGHRTRAGLVSDAQVGGGPFLRIEHPSVAGHDGEPLCEFYAPGSIFAIHPCSEDDAKKAAETYWRKPFTEPPALSAGFAELVDDDDDECTCERTDCDECTPF